MTKRILFVAATSVAIVGCQSGQSAVVYVPATQPVAAVTPTPTTQPIPLQTPLQAQLSSILNRLASTGATVSARVIDPSTGQELFAQDADTPVTPASNMKITTTAAAFELFGPDYMLETNLYVVGDDLYLLGSGDPGTGDEPIAKKLNKDPLAFMDKWADELAAMGKTHLSGKLYYIDGAFEAQQVHPDWGSGDRVEWYGAPIGGLNLNDNCIDITVTPATQPGQPATVTTVPETSPGFITLTNRTTTVDPATTKPSTDGPEAERAADSNSYTVKGNVWETKLVDSKPVTDPGAFFADVLRTRLAKHGITIDGGIAHREMAGHMPNGGQWLTPAKTKFSDMLARLLKNSQNMFADATAKLIGCWPNETPQTMRRERSARTHAEVGSWANGEVAIRNFLHRHHIDDSHYVFADGSGLSGRNKVTTRLITDIFATMMKDPNYEVWKNCLTIAGVDGTTRNRLKDKPNRVFCKTGYISGVRSLSGYAITDSGKTLVFSIIYNHIPGRGSERTKPYEALQDEAVRVLLAQ